MHVIIECRKYTLIAGAQIVIASSVVSVDACLFHDGQELSLAYLAVTVLVELVDHGLELIVAQVLLHFPGNSTQVPQRYAARVVLVKQLERLGDLLDWVSLADLGGHDLQEVRVLDLAGSFAVKLPHQVEHLLLFYVEAQGSHANLQLVVVDGSGLVGVEKLEGLLDFLFLLVGKVLLHSPLDSEFHLLLLSQKFWLLEHF